VIERLKRIAPTDAGVLITGEFGARARSWWPRPCTRTAPARKKPFVALNCGAVAEHLVESELFGHIKGSFTDAVTDRMGKFEYANGGTLFLDEVGDMPLSTQIKLLRVLEERQITRVGDNKPIKVNVRVLSATNRDLTEAIKQGTFRNDLYFRLKIVTVDLPRLADRKEDIVPLVFHFRKQFAKHHQKTIRGVAPAVTKRFYEYDWPGNIRQLRNAVETMVVLDIDGLLDLDDLPPELAEPTTLPAASDNGQPARAAEVGENGALPHLAAEAGPVALVGRSLDDIERWAIEQTLQLTGGNREETARILGIGARTLYRKLEKIRTVTREVRGQRSEVRGRRSEVGGQRSEVRGRRSEVRGQRSEVGGRRSGVGGRKTHYIARPVAGISPMRWPHVCGNPRCTQHSADRGELGSDIRLDRTRRFLQA